MAVNDRTAARDYPLPHSTNRLQEDVLRLRDALDAIDSDVTAAMALANARLPSASYTAADVLSKLLTVDGAGSNLDADMLDGVSGSGYALSAHAHDNMYAAISHLHTGVYAIVAHDHAGLYAAMNHHHDSAYAAIGHLHSGVYSPTGHTHSYPDLTNRPAIPTACRLFFMSQI